MCIPLVAFRRSYWPLFNTETETCILCAPFYHQILLLLSSVDLLPPPPLPPPHSSAPLLPCSSPPLPSLSTLSGSLYRLLLDLLELLFDKFKAVAQAHSVVLAHLQQIAAQCPAGANEEGIKLYEQADVSAKIQTVLQVSMMHMIYRTHTRTMCSKLVLHP